MKLVSLLEPKLVLCRGRAANYPEAKEKLLALLAARTELDADFLRAALAEREALASIVIAPGIAFPHARVASLSDFHLVIGTFPHGVAMAGEKEPVRLIVLYFIPEASSNIYLRAASAMAEFLSAPGSLDRLLAASSPDALIQVLASSRVMVRNVVTARDVMTPNPPSLRLLNTLREAADLMVKHRMSEVPVTDEEGNFLGVVRAERLLKVGLPDYLLAMKSLAFLTEFEPFQDLLKNEQSMTVSEILDRDVPHFLAHTPMIIVAGSLVRDAIPCAAVLEGTRLVGMISLLNFIHKVVRA
ncbi:MAG: PTS sugar transporter subunit IIA [Planctomycetota bacterium]